MSGELILKNSQRWKQTVPAVLLTIGAAFILVALLAHSMKMSAMTYTLLGAVLAYILFRTLYPRIVKAMPGGTRELRKTWTLTGDTLQLGEETIPLDNIKMLHCWPNRDALGHQLTGWLVNIETKKGRNHVLCSLDEGDVEASVESLHALVTALGYEARWVAEPGVFDQNQDQL